MLHKYSRDMYPDLPIYDNDLAFATGNVIKVLYDRFKESDMTYQELSSQTGICVSSLLSYFNFTSVPSLASYIRLVDVLYGYFISL